MKLSKPLVFILFILLFSSIVTAHSYQVVSYSKIQIEGDTAIFNNEGDAYFITDNYEELKSAVIDGVKIYNEGEECKLVDFKEGDLTQTLLFNAKCDKEITNFQVNDTYLPDGPIEKIYNVKYENASKTFIGETEIHFEYPVNQDEPKDEASQTSIFSKYVGLGVEHIWAGTDHVFFILGYILLAATLIGLTKGITGFTISHSFTLTLAALGILTISPSIVEPLIALSIAIVGILSLWNIGKGWLIRFGIIFLFGLFHGLGFAGSIAEVGFPKEGFISALLGFNIGIELGQLTIVAIVFPILFYLDKKHKLYGLITRKLLGVIVTIGGIFWFIQRLFF